MALKTALSDPADSLPSPGAECAYLEAAFEEGDAAFIFAALGEIARTRGMTTVAREIGITRQAMHAHGPDGNPTVETLIRVVKALGLRLSVRKAA